MLVVLVIADKQGPRRNDRQKEGRERKGNEMVVLIPHSLSDIPNPTVDLGGVEKQHDVKILLSHNLICSASLLSWPSDQTMDNRFGPTIAHQSDFLEMASMDGFTNGFLTRLLFVMIVGIVVVIVIVVVVVSSSSLLASGLAYSFWLA